MTALLVPGIGIDHGSNLNNAGAWQGVFSQKNQLGIATALSVAVALGFRATGRLDEIWRWCLISEALVCAAKSQSREAWISIALEVGAFLFLRCLEKMRLRARLPALMLGMLVFACVMVFAYLTVIHAPGVVGRSSTASGRTAIWRDSLLLIGRRPWFGYGTYGVWKTPIAWEVVVREGWDVTTPITTTWRFFCTTAW